MAKFVVAVKSWFSTHPDVSIVLGAGAIGGLLATAIQGLLKHDGNLVTYVIPIIPFGKSVLYALLGAIAAALSVYIAANSKLDDLKRLTFFALLCGITFPAILASSVDQAGEDAQQKLELSRRVALDSPEAAATVAVEAFEELPTAPVDRATEEAIKVEATALVKQLQNQGTEAGMQAANNVVQSANNAGIAIEAPPAPPPAQ